MPVTRKSLKWKCKVNNLKSELCMENQGYTVTSRMKRVLPPTHTLWLKCAFPQGFTFHIHAEEHVAVINISLIWSPLNLCSTMVTWGEQTGIRMKELCKGQWAEICTLVWEVSITEIGKLRQEIPLEVKHRLMLMVQTRVKATLFAL